MVNLFCFDYGTTRKSCQTNHVADCQGKRNGVQSPNTMCTKSNTNTNKLRRRNKEYSILNAITEALNREVDLDQALRTALAQVADLLDLQTGWIWLLHPDSGESYLAASQNLPLALVHTPQRMEGNCHCLDTYRAGDLGGPPTSM